MLRLLCSLVLVRLMRRKMRMGMGPRMMSLWLISCRCPLPSSCRPWLSPWCPSWKMV